ncbi:S8 family serine peptidase [Pontibacter sp. G13]|uniref:S8 family serine peptidase n=1 Tax=Pontibacter sp. G13 TaxID=3074898 RepID=UPI00288B1532|nr:S8 family serine peptidase [Pontibacter sp. G13]WNJ20875.1 S8 family serine peptidase [Pontibacter sp. G13]
MRKFWLLACLLSGLSPMMAQSNMWVFFQDKGPQAAQLLEHPETFLSTQALDRRAEKGIAVTAQDLPLHSDYVSAISAQGWNILGKSKWLNAVAISGEGTDWDQVMALPFVDGIYPVASMKQHNAPETTSEAIDITPTPLSDWAYGQSTRQNEMLNIRALHDQGFTGKGIRVAVLDAGFRGADTITAFDSLRAHNRLIAAWDFVDGDDDVFHGSSHGTEVLSTIATYLPGEMIGTAPEVSVLLARTENDRSETRQEEYNFMEAVEWADSIGVDVLHASLGYSEFDTEEESYTYEQMDGNTAITTKAADWAASRGIIVTVSAGNEGNGAWRHITAPCDGDSVLCVGAVDKYIKRAGFSSIGPAADGRIKPDVMAMGAGTTVVTPRGRVSKSNGTSFSGPIMAGFVACLKQAHPERSNMDIIRAVQLSGDQAGLPDADYGYGIPNAGVADSLLGDEVALATVEIVQSEKPLRGRQATASARPPKALKTPTFTQNPQTQVSVEGGNLSISTEEAAAAIQTYEIRMGNQVVKIDADEITLSPNSVVISTTYLIPGEYYVVISSDKFEEVIPFQISE